MYILKTDICNEQNNEIVPQVSHLGYGYDYEAADSATKIIYNEPLDFLPNLKFFYLDPETKVTDIIRQSYIFTAGLLVSEALYNSIKKYTLQPHYAYATKIVYNDIYFNYYWLHITKKLEIEIDYSKSEFIEIDANGSTTIKKISNHEEFRQKCKELVDHLSGDIIARKILFLNNTPLYDLFFIDFTSRKIFISQEMKDCLLQNRFTGFEILPSETKFST